MKHFIVFLNNKWAQWNRVLFPGRLFHPSLMFVSKAIAYLSKKLSTAALWGWLLALPTNIELLSKSLLGANTLAHLGTFKGETENKES